MTRKAPHGYPDTNPSQPADASQGRYLPVGKRHGPPIRAIDPNEVFALVEPLPFRHPPVGYVGAAVLSRDDDRVTLPSVRPARVHRDGGLAHIRVLRLAAMLP